MKTFFKLKERIKCDLNINATDFIRLYHGREQLSSGAFSWDCLDMDTGIRFGSTCTATELISQSEKLRFLESSHGAIPEIV